MGQRSEPFPVPALLRGPPLVLLNDVRSNDVAAFSPLGSHSCWFFKRPPEEDCLGALLHAWGRVFRSHGKALIAVASNRDSL